MRYLDRLPIEPTAWLLALLLLGVIGSLLWIVLSNITL